MNTDLDAEARQKQIIDTLRMVGLLPDHVSYYPHMLAPGQKQRWPRRRGADPAPEGYRLR